METKLLDAELVNSVVEVDFRRDVPHTGSGNILVPVDLTPRSLEAARYVTGLARALGSRVTFLHVINPDWQLDVNERDIQSRLIEFLKVTGGSFVIQHGNPAKVIADVADSKHADLIMMATRGQSRLSRWFRPSVTAQVLRRSRCPVLAAPSHS